MLSFQYQSTLILSIIGRQGELLHALILISTYSHFQYNREARGATSCSHPNINLFSFLVLFGGKGSYFMHSFHYQSIIIPSIIGRQGELLHALISISIYSHSQYNREARGATSCTHFNINLLSFNYNREARGATSFSHFNINLLSFLV